MASTDDLSFAYLEAHPIDAARVLERIAPQNVAALLEEVPARIAAPVLRAMLPLHVARCVEPLGDDQISGLMRALGPQAGVAVLHYVPDVRRMALLAQMPTALALACRLLLGYPEDSVGAWMDPRALALPGDTTAAAALQQLRETDGDGDASLFVLGPGQRLLGVAALPDVLRAPDDTPLTKVMRKITGTLPARAPIRAVEGHAGWANTQRLPVVEREDRFVGALDRAVLARALLRAQRTPHEGYDDAAARLAGSYWSGVSSLIQFFVALLPVTRPQSVTDGHER